MALMSRCARVGEGRLRRVDAGGRRSPRSDLSGFRDDVDRLAATLGAELDSTGLECEQGVVATASDVHTGVELGAALADQDLTGAHPLPAETLHTETLGVGITTVARAGRALLVCNLSVLLRSALKLDYLIPVTLRTVSF